MAGYVSLPYIMPQCCAWKCQMHLLLVGACKPLKFYDLHHFRYHRTRHKATSFVVSFWKNKVAGHFKSQRMFAGFIRTLKAIPIKMKKKKTLRNFFLKFQKPKDWLKQSAKFSGLFFINPFNNHSIMYFFIGAVHANHQTSIVMPRVSEWVRDKLEFLFNVVRDVVKRKHKQSHQVG